LAILSSEFGGELQPAKQFLTSRLPAANDFIDPMIFKGDVVTRSERIAVLQTLNQYKPRRHIPVVQDRSERKSNKKLQMPDKLNDANTKIKEKHVVERKPCRQRNSKFPGI